MKYISQYIIMFHHQKSSRSSDENLEINLLRAKNRESGVNFVRVHHNNIILNRSKRGSAHVCRSGEFQNDLDNNIYDNYTVLDHVDFSQSLLTSPNENSSVVGFILFILLIAFTPLETLILCASQQKLNMYFILTMLEWLIACQLLSFIILYHCKWVERITIFTTYMRTKRQYREQNATFLQKLASHPYVLFLIALLLTFVWQISYANALLNHNQIAHLILLYFIILPEIVGSLCYEEELSQSRILQFAFYGGVIYLSVCGLVVDVWMGLGGLSGILLICLSIRLGRVILFMEYISKLILVLIVAAIHIYGNYGDDVEEWQQDPVDVSSIIIFLLLATFSIIIVRCINNKILRVQLYKYFYSDQTINNALLCLPIAVGLILNWYLDVWISGLGCGVLLLVSYFVGRQKQEININLNGGEGEKEQDKNKAQQLQQMR